MNETIILCLSVLLLTSFVRVFTSLTILRYGLGLYASSFGLIVFTLSLAMSFYVSSPFIDKIGGFSNITNYEAVQEEFRPFLEKKADKKFVEDFKNKLISFNDNVKKEAGTDESVDENTKASEKNISSISKKQELDVLTFSFVVTELRDALKYGLIILIPFLIIDLIVMNIFMVLGVKNFSYQVASLPIKLGIFVACDGLKIISEKLINYYL